VHAHVCVKVTPKANPVGTGQYHPYSDFIAA
jgi:hypothetical protein